MRDATEIEEQKNEADIAASEGGSYPAMSYEDGVSAALAWVLEETDETPIETDSGDAPDTVLRPKKPKPPMGPF